MAVNPNTSLPNRHTLYLAKSGGGKSQALMQNPEVPKRGARVVLFDPDEDHKAIRCHSLASFHRALCKAIVSGRPFRLAYCGDATPAIFEKWAGMVWAILDGRRKTYVLIEELAAVVTSSGKAGDRSGVLLRQGRKYGAIIHATTQRGAEIPKTIYTQCAVKWIGMQDDFDVPKIARLTGEDPDQIRALKPLQFRVMQPGEPTKTVTLKYKKPA